MTVASLWSRRSRPYSVIAILRSTRTTPYYVVVTGYVMPFSAYRVRQGTMFALTYREILNSYPCCSLLSCPEPDCDAFDNI